jgi:pentapeptide MXKDX repeat protein
VKDNKRHAAACGLLGRAGYDWHVGLELYRKSKPQKGATRMTKRIAILVMAMGMSMGLANRVTTIALAQSQDGKMQSDDKMKDDKMAGDKMAGDKKGKTQKKSSKKDAMSKDDKMSNDDKMSDQGKAEQPKQ